MNDHILILGSDADEHSRHVRDELVRREHAVEFLDISDYPASLGLAFDPRGRRGVLRFPNGKRVAFDEVAAVYWRNYNRPSAVSLPLREQAFIAENDARSMVETLLDELPARWVNGWSGYLLHQRKPAALARVAALGVRIPETLVTNDAVSLRAFAESAPYPLIFKPVQGGAHARRLEPDHLTDANLQTLHIAPVTVQEEIAGTNVRVFVAGERAVGCEIEAETLDFRDDPRPKIRAIRLDDMITKQSLQIARTLDLLWTGIDYRVTPAGEFVYLEANPSPMFMGFERQTDLPLTRLLCDLLTNG